MALTLLADNIHVIEWWIHGASAVHTNMRSHTGVIMSLGKESVYSALVEKQINTRSSTETESVAVNDLTHMVLWTYYFLKDQGYDAGKSIIYQDNKSAILLEKNDKASSSNQTQHINSQYFFVKNRIEKGE
eukprot:2247345-Ditylum_brightwellii.AAC.1